MKFSGLALTTALYVAMALVVFGLGGCSTLAGGGKATEAAPIAPATGAVTAGIESAPVPDLATKQDDYGSEPPPALNSVMEGEEADPEWNQHTPELRIALKLFGQRGEKLEALGEPSRVGTDRNKLVRQVPGTHAHYFWKFTSSTDVKSEYIAAVGDDSGLVDGLRVDILNPPGKIPVVGERPTIPEVATLIGQVDQPELFYRYNAVMARYGSGKKRVVIYGYTTHGSPIVEKTKTDFSTGTQSNTISRSAHFSLERTLVYAVFIGELDPHGWNVFGNSTQMGFRPMPD